MLYDFLINVILLSDTFKNIDKDILYEDFIVNPVP